MNNTLKDCMRTMVDAFKELNQAKDDCKDVVESAYDVYSKSETPEGEIEEVIDRKAIVKVCKAIASQKLDVFEDEMKEGNKLMEFLEEIKE